MSSSLSTLKNFLTSTLKLLGKPILYLITLIVILVFAYFKLLYLFTQKIGHLFSQVQYPHFSLILPTRLPKLALKSWVFLSLASLPILACSLFYYFIVKDLPSPELLRTNLPFLSTKILDRNGRLLYQIYRDENRSLIELSDLPPHLIQATIASEDKDFYHHFGISVSGIARAARNNLSGNYLQGGSTLTQQLVKNALLTPEKTITRKLKEVVLSLWTERLYSKNQILEMYFNYVPYGGTAYGVESASRQYFGKSATDLTLAESAFLAGLPVSPTTLSPFGAHPYLAKSRQSQVLDRMVEENYLSPDLALSAKNETIALRPQETNILAPHFVMYIKDLLVQEFGEHLVSHGGLEVTTTLDLDTQQILENEIDLELAKIKSLNVNNAAGLVLSPKSGEIIAMVGSHDFFDTKGDGQVNVVLQPRQPGSSIKPLTYALAFMNGFRPNSIIEDSPICFKVKGQAPYCPKNYDGSFHGNVTLRTALASSYNIPAIKLLNTLGVDNLVKLAREMGISTWENSSRFGLSLTLGGGEITMLDLASAYSVFANYGTKVPLISILSIKQANGQSIIPTVKEKKQVLTPEIAYQISDILSDRNARAPAFGTNSILNIPAHQVAVKTGTTNSLRDNWTIGYTEDLLLAAWVGNNDNTPMSNIASGITGASPIWSNTMKKLLKSSPDIAFVPPANLVPVKLCPKDGKPYCDNQCSLPPKIEYFVKGTEPIINCSLSGQIL